MCDRELSEITLLAHTSLLKSVWNFSVMNITKFKPFIPNEVFWFNMSLCYLCAELTKWSVFWMEDIDMKSNNMRGHSNSFRLFSWQFNLDLYNFWQITCPLFLFQHAPCNEVNVFIYKTLNYLWNYHSECRFIKIKHVGNLWKVQEMKFKTISPIEICKLLCI